MRLQLTQVHTVDFVLAFSSRRTGAAILLNHVKRDVVDNEKINPHASSPIEISACHSGGRPAHYLDSVYNLKYTIFTCRTLSLARGGIVKCRIEQMRSFTTVCIGCLDLHVIHEATQITQSLFYFTMAKYAGTIIAISLHL